VTNGEGPMVVHLSIQLKKRVFPSNSREKAKRLRLYKEKQSIEKKKEKPNHEGQSRRELKKSLVLAP